MEDEISRAELEAAHCWESEDRVPRHPDMTDFRRRVRYHQAQWREAHGHPIGTQPINPKPGGAVRPVGSRIPAEYARETGASLLTRHALDAVRARLALKEPEQSIDQQRIWADLLSPTAMGFNLFGDLAADHSLADRAVHTWWPDTPGAVSDVRFLHSPGWLDQAYLGNLSSFDVAFVTDRGDGTQGIIGIAARYHERANREVPKPRRLAHYRKVAETSGAFAPGALDAVDGDLTVMWLDHLLVLSMLRHPSGEWTWGRFVVVHPAGNLAFADACARYRDLLADTSTFASITVEELLDSKALPGRTTAALRDRYLLR